MGLLMIVADSFLWLHLPKTGGTSMNRLFRDRRIPGVEVDPDDTPAKHDSVALRESRGPWRAGARRRFITARRLEAWLTSVWLHHRRHSNLPALDFTPVRSGLFYSVRAGGVWMAADWWLRYFEVDAGVQALRLEFLTDDLDRWVRPLLPGGTPAFAGGAAPWENARPVGSEVPAFSAEDRVRLRAANPLWVRWEREVYGPAADAPEAGGPSQR